MLESQYQQEKKKTKYQEYQGLRRRRRHRRPHLSSPETHPHRPHLSSPETHPHRPHLLRLRDSPVLQEVFRCSSIPENLFGKFSIFIDKKNKGVHTMADSPATSDEGSDEVSESGNVGFSKVEVEGLRHLTLTKMEMTNHNKRLKLCIKWFQQVDENHNLDKVKLQSDLEAMHKKWFDAEMDMLDIADHLKRKRIKLRVREATVLIIFFYFIYFFIFTFMTTTMRSCRHEGADRGCEISKV
ncbi:hypothetical protein LWI28_003878 [Acer negundo]|uniref:Uncharacterized protein n=1 Tax=Acer negundo TaxID=4023 RepID=A0AAD5NKD8_ACENE|nr:hypothetical protein LWI28_003878 [Acer negundo]